ncbi:D-lactate dehydrogenase [Microbacterium trichothecenolyticum]|uniref:FAD-binding and (Fe-S)-binding domain-containing protein n=1 Tax=Microbacterium trichothecenolyticum TaxID=69370 RepID=UPI002858795F|nr:FAD-binding and (Fe-S)-binding domain-containing protein [Microbacterium trichothecenolyticum]MDR7184579.1 D-lactate dehydrogenase [Microbacterium trichothecenolyticum]
MNAALAEALGAPAGLSTRTIDRVAYAADASHYLLTPSAVLVAESSDEVATVLRAASASGTAVTFRSGGTSLSGQSSTGGVLIDTRRAFRRIEVLDSGARVRVQPGATVRQVNARLLRHGFRLGPDPASEAACTIGGVIANNSSGMACGITENTYRTLESMVFVLPSGTVVDTAAPDADARLRALEPALFAGLERLMRRVRADPSSRRIIAERFAMKNTIGYGINSLVDFDTPVQVLAHLVIGSEGTLAFVAEATYRTVPIRPHAATALALFPSLGAATEALPALVATGAAALELMDATSLRVGQQLPDTPAALTGIDVTGRAALLIEYQAMDDITLAAQVHGGSRVLNDLPLITPTALSADSASRSRAWKLRKGLYASVAGARPSGTTALLEDIVVPVTQLAATCEALQGLFASYGYRDSVIFGHAKDGNIHFMLTDRFEQGAGADRLAAFTEDMVALVLEGGGNLKAEHGTGRAMAPYVRRQYGEELYGVMREIKALCDPAGILNPGVVLDDDPAAHVRDIKLTETIEPEADRCVECGYCEPVCPSKDLTLTPRQRIVVRRAIARAEADGDHTLVAELERDYDYDGVDTCAVDGMCITACPVLINTGDLVKRLRRERPTPAVSAVWRAAAPAWGTATRVAAAALTVADRVPAPLVRAATDLGRAVMGDDVVPQYSADLPGGGRPRRRLRGVQGAASGVPLAVYVPACVNSMFAAEHGGDGVADAFVRLCATAGVQVIVPEEIEGLCCSTPWTSKGQMAGRAIIQDRVVRALTALGAGTGVRLVSDAASCTEGFVHLLEDAGIAPQMEDALAFVAREILPRLGTIEPIVNTLVLHPTCSSVQLGLDGALREIAAVAAREVIVPAAWGCCAFAGDRGMLHPELTASATAAEAAEVRELADAGRADAFASCNRTCELGMTRATGHPYRHVIEMLDAAVHKV